MITGTGFNVDSGIEKNLVKIPKSLLNQKVKWNHQLEVHDHFQVQFWEKDNLPKCQGGVQNLGKFKWM